MKSIALGIVAVVSMPTLTLSETTMESKKAAQEVRGNMAEMREEAAYKLGVEAARHLGVDVDGKKSYQKLEQEKKQAEAERQRQQQTDNPRRP